MKWIFSSWQKTLLLVVGGMGLLVIIFRLLIPPQTPVSLTPALLANRDDLPITLTNIRFAGPTPALPTSLPIIAVKSTLLSSTQVLSALANNWSFQLVPGTNNSWQADRTLLDHNPGTNLWTLTFEQTDYNSALVSPDLATQLFDSAIKKYLGFFNTNLLRQNQNPTYLIGNLEYSPTTNRNQANAVALTADYILEDIPIKYENSDHGLIEAIVAPEMVAKITFIPLVIELGDKAKSPLLTLTQALNAINAGHAAIIAYQTTSVESVKFEDIRSGTLNEVVIEYRIDSDTDQLIPFYRFSGTLTDAESNTLDVQLITPAVATQEKP